MTFQSYFERLEAFVVDASDVPHLRQMILGLALSGHLDDAESELTESGAELDSEFAQTREDAALALGAVSLRSKFDRLGNIAVLRRGLTAIQRAVPGEFSLITTADGRVPCDHYDFEGPAALIPLVSSSGHGKASMKRLHFEEGPFALGTILCAVFPRDPAKTSARFLYEYLTAFKEELLVARMVGTANVSLTIEKLSKVPVPLISSRAASKLEKLMSYCDELETSLSQVDVQRDATRNAALRELAQGTHTSPSESTFLLDSLLHSTTKSAHISEVRHAIIDLAVRGRLTSRRPSDEPVHAFLEEVRRNSVIQAVSASRKKRVVPAASDSDLDPLPTGWAQVCLADLCVSITDGDHQPPPQVADGVPFLVIGDVLKQPMNMVDSRRVPSDYYMALDDSRRPRNGDILYTLVGATLGRPVLVENSEPFCVQRHVAILRPSSIFPVEFLMLVLSSNLAYRQALACATGTGQKTVPLSGLRSFRIPVPPLSEQERITGRVAELMSICDDFDSALRGALMDRIRLQQSLVRVALDSNS